MVVRQRLRGGQHGAEIGALVGGRGAQARPAHGAVFKRRRQQQGGEKRVDVRLRAAGDQGQRAVQLGVQPFQQRHEFARNHHLVGPGCEFGQRAIKIKKQGAWPRQQAW
ncbi:hypothetical protein D9M68_907430 [compost metagenome]